MASGYSRVRFFTPLGAPIGELDVATKRSWVINDVGRCQFEVAIYDASASNGFNAKCSDTFLRYGNLVLINHVPSQNADGTFNGLLPDWVGIILPPRQWQYGTVNVTAYSAEAILKYRPMPYTTMNGTPGAIFTQILQAAATLTGGIAIQPGVISNAGNTIPQQTRLSGFEEIKTLINNSGYDFDITPSLNPDGSLSLYGNWYQSKGVATRYMIGEHNTQKSDPIYTEQGEIYNTVFGFNDANTDGARAIGLSYDDERIAANGALGINVVFSGTQGGGAGVVQGMTDWFLAGNKYPTRTIAPTVLDTGNAFSNLVTGNSLLVQMNTVGFENGQIGLNGSVRIAALEYSDVANTAKFAGVYSS